MISRSLPPLVILGSQHERSECEEPGDPCRNTYDGCRGAELPKLKLAKVWKDFHIISPQPVVSIHTEHFFTPNLSPSFQPAAYLPSQIRFQTGSLVRTGCQGEASASGLVVLR
ncbi:hypothetical protein D3Y55_07155 [Mesorhizobium sp. DCY119]|nr:hypothetical protein D3Y55_07155 [Mesorhizobium sp. DCY119]